MSDIIPANVKAFWPFGDAVTAAAIADTTGRGNDLTPYLRINEDTGEFRMGRNAAVTYSGQQAFAALKGWGRWERALSSGEKTALYGGGTAPEYGSRSGGVLVFPTTHSLEDATAYYPLDEASASATYADAVGNNDLTLVVAAPGTTVRTIGPAGVGDNATQLLPTTGTVALAKVSPASGVRSRQVTTTVCGWVNLTSKPTTPSGLAQQVFWGQLNNDTGISGFNVYFDPTADRFALDVNAGDGSSLTQGTLTIENVYGSPTIGVWYFLICVFNTSANTSSISVNNGTATTLSNILQPTVVSGVIGSASKFFLNPAGVFGTQTSGWDVAALGYPAINGNSHVTHAANADISFGNNAKCVWGWFKLTDAVTYQTIAGFYDGVGAGTGTDWIIQQAGNVLYFVFGKELAYSNVALSDTTSWHLVVAWFDKINNRIHIDLDHGAASDNDAGPATPQTVSNEFRFGSDAGPVGAPGNDHQFTGSACLWGIADGVPSATDLDTLWNSGNGWAFSGGGTVYTSSLFATQTEAARQSRQIAKTRAATQATATTKALSVSALRTPTQRTSTVSAKQVNAARLASAATAVTMTAASVLARSLNAVQAVAVTLARSVLASRQATQGAAATQSRSVSAGRVATQSTAASQSRVTTLNKVTTQAESIVLSAGLFLTRSLLAVQSTAVNLARLVGVGRTATQGQSASQGRQVMVQAVGNLGRNLWNNLRLRQNRKTHSSDGRPLRVVERRRIVKRWADHCLEPEVGRNGHRRDERIPHGGILRYRALARSRDAHGRHTRPASQFVWRCLFGHGPEQCYDCRDGVARHRRVLAQRHVEFRRRVRARLGDNVSCEFSFRRFNRRSQLVSRSHRPMMNCGIYAIRRLTDGKCYVGSSQNITSRWAGHVRQLDAGRYCE